MTSTPITQILALYLPLGLPLVAAAVAAVASRQIAAWFSVATAMAIAGSGCLLAAAVIADGPTTTAGGLLRADALSVFMLLLIGAVAVIATWTNVYYLDTDIADGATTHASARRYLILVQLFIASMCAAVEVDNLGLLWVAVETTTIVTAFLVGHHRKRAAIEAAWKYVVLCSAGIGIAFLGTVCVYAASVAGGSPHGITALNWTYLTGDTNALDPGVMRLAIGLLVVGFGTKAGLAPMHAWLPDAHSQAPAPVSAFMSGVLLSVALYAILRYKSIGDAVLGSGYLRGLLLTAALLTLAVAALLLIAQRDYKRMLAYSSMEHMALVTLGAAIGGPLATAAALLHMLGHGLAKATLFCGAGHILHTTGSSSMVTVRGLSGRAPGLAAVFGMGLLALLGLPPFSLFASELGIARGGFTEGFGWAVAAALAMVLVIFAAIARHGTGMLLGVPSTELAPATLAPRRVALAPLIVGLLAAAILGVTLGPLDTLLETAATIVVAPGNEGP